MSTTESIQTGNGVEVTRSLHQVIQRNLRVNHLALHKKLMVSQPHCSHVVLQEVCWTPLQSDQNVHGLYVVWQQQLSINIFCPTSAANLPATAAAVAAVDR